MDPSSNINQYFSANYRVLRKYTAALLSNVIVEAYQNDTTLFTSGRTNSSGNVSLMLLSFNKTDSDINYFNYTVFFSKENFRSENESLNITKLNQTYYNLTVNMMTLKGIVPSGAIACANSYRYFCAESNPLSILNLKPGLKYRINFTINATGNGFAFPLDNVNSFFIFANSNILKVNQSESSRVNITIAP
jgi:hypothetical protein